MNKKLLFVYLAAITLMLGGFLYLKSRPDSAISGQKTDSSHQTTTSPKAEMPNTNSAALGEYKNYNAGSRDIAAGTEILFFYAPWCPQCRALDADIIAKGVPSGVTIYKVDYDSNQALRKQYGVTIQTTLVRIDSNGKLVKKYVAYESPTLQSIKDNLLQ